MGKLREDFYALKQTPDELDKANRYEPVIGAYRITIELVLPDIEQADVVRKVSAGGEASWYCQAIIDVIHNSYRTVDPKGDAQIDGDTFTWEGQIRQYHSSQKFLDLKAGVPHPDPLGTWHYADMKAIKDK